MLVLRRCCASKTDHRVTDGTTHPLLDRLGNALVRRADVLLQVLVGREKLLLAHRSQFQTVFLEKTERHQSHLALPDCGNMGWHLGIRGSDVVHRARNLLYGGNVQSKAFL